MRLFRTVLALAELKAGAKSNQIPIPLGPLELGSPLLKTSFSSTTT
jgi:hypothetical protein